MKISRTAALHVARGEAGHLVGGDQIRLQQPAQVAGGDGLKGAPVPEGGVVDQAVETPVSRHHRIEAPRDGGEVGDVERSGEGVGNGRRRFLHPRLVAAVDPDASARRRHAARHLEAEAPARAGDEHHPAFEREALDTLRIAHSVTRPMGGLIDMVSPGPG